MLQIFFAVTALLQASRYLTPAERAKADAEEAAAEAARRAAAADSSRARALQQVCDPPDRMTCGLGVLLSVHRIGCAHHCAVKFA